MRHGAASTQTRGTRVYRFEMEENSKVFGQGLNKREE